MQADHIRFRQQFVETAPAEARPIGRVSSARVVGNDAHPHRCRDRSHIASNAAKAYDAHRLALQLDQGRLPEAEIRGSRPLSRVCCLAMKADVMAEFQKEGKD